MLNLRFNTKLILVLSCYFPYRKSNSNSIDNLPSFQIHQLVSVFVFSQNAEELMNKTSAQAFEFIARFNCNVKRF